MKVLIADDEEHVREGIDLAVDWAKFGVKERLMAEDGVQAMELIRKHRPAVLFCDMSMPGIDGMELLGLIRQEGWDIQIIVVSGHNDFQYTKAAIRANGIDYILKPFRKKDLEHALEQALAIWRQKETSLRDKLETEYRLRKADAMLDEQKLALFFKGEAGFHEGIRSLIYKIGLPMEQIRAAVVLPKNKTKIVDRRFYGDEELFIFALNNITHEIVKPYGLHYLCRLDDYQWVLITSSDGAFRPADSYRRYMDKLAVTLESTLGLKVLIGLGEAQAGVEELPAAVRGARAALLECDILGAAKQKTKVKASERQIRFIDQQVLLAAAIKNGDKAYASQIIRSFTQSLRERGSLRLKELQVYTNEANLLLEQQASRLTPAGGALMDPFVPPWISDLDEWENVLVQQWWMLMESDGAERSHGIQSIHNYIHSHLQEDISLAMLSERFHFSPQYIAKKFKEQYNTTVMSYVTELRIGKSKSLLMHTEMSVSEIAKSVGYSDENYFSKVFKKQIGHSPLQFRKLQRDS